MASTFFDRIDLLSEQVGEGILRAKLEVDQVYAHIQEVADEFKHPRGGQSRYLRDSLYVDLDKHLGTLARKAITPEGSDIKDGMKDVAEDLSSGVHERAPIEFYHLKRSGHPSVEDNGAVIYDRPPIIPRLNEAQLRHLRRHGELPGGPL